MVIYTISIRSRSLQECYLSILPNTVSQNFLCTQAFPAVSMISFLTTKHCCCQEFGLMIVFIFIAVKNIKQYRILNSESCLMLQNWLKCAYLEQHVLKNCIIILTLSCCKSMSETFHASELLLFDLVCINPTFFLEYTMQN